MKTNEIMQQITSVVDAKPKSNSKTDSLSDVKFHDVMKNNLKGDTSKDNSSLIHYKKRAEHSPNTIEKGSSASQSSKSDRNNKAASTKSTNSEDAYSLENKKNKVNDLVEVVKETVVKELNITPEELESAMECLGLNFVQLMDPSNLTKLFTQLQGVSPTELLTNENLSAQFTNLLNAINQINLSDFNLSKEDITNFLQQNEYIMQDSVQQGQLDHPAENTAVISEEDLVNDMDSSKETTNGIQGEQSEISVEVKKYSEASSEEHNQSKEGASESQINDSNLNTILNNLSGVKTVDSFSDGLTQVQQVRDVVNQVVEQIKIVIKPEQTSMEMNLNPENLGRLKLVVEQKNGLMTAQFTVQNEFAKEALESQLQTLKDNFSQQGLKVQAVEVNISELPFSQEEFAGQGEQQQKSSKKQKNINLDDYLSDPEDLSDEEEIKIDMMTKSGNRVDYSA